MLAKRFLGLGAGEGDGDGKSGDKDGGGDGGELPLSGPSCDLDGEAEKALRRSIVGIVVRVYCAGRLRSSSFPINGESRAKPYEGYDSEDIENRVMDEIDTLFAKSIFDGDVQALRNFSSRSNSSSPTYSVCGKLFKPQDVVYSCRDCALDNTCVLCANCFAQSAHASHNYRMHASGGGGYCDCGDVEAWHRDPGCRLHTCSEVTSSSATATASTIQSGDLSSEIIDRARPFLRYVLRFIEQIFTGPMDALPADLHAAFAAAYPTALSGWLTILFNDEVHSFDEVIRTLRHAVDCSNSMAETFATSVDRKGRALIFYGRESACRRATTRVSERSAQENQKHMPLRVQAASFALFQLQELAVRLLDTIIGRLLPNSPEMQHLILDALETSVLRPSEVAPEGLADSSPSAMEQADQKLVVDSLLIANSTLWKSARSSSHQFFMAAAFSIPECRRRFGFAYARNYSQIMSNFVERDFHHYKDSIVSLSVQLFTVPSLVVSLVEQHNFVVKIAGAIRTAIEPAISTDTGIVPSSEHFESEDVPPFLIEHMAETLNDIEYILRSLPPEPPTWSAAIEDSVLRGFAAFVHQVMNPFTGTDALKRRTTDHVEWDPVLTNTFTFFDSVHPTLFLFYNRLVCPSRPDRLKTALSLIRPTLLAALRSLNCLSVHNVKLELRNTSDKHGSVLSPPKQRKADQSNAQSSDMEYSVQLLPPVTIEAECVSFVVAEHAVSLHNGVTRVVYDLMGGAATLDFDPWSLLSSDDSDQLKPVNLMEPALRVLVYQAQVQAGMWRRNGLAVAQQIAFYRHHSEACHQFDLDLLALQLAAASSNDSIDQFLLRIVDKFGLVSWLASNSGDYAIQVKQKQMSDIVTRYGTSLIDEMLLLLIHIMMERYRPGLGENISQRDYLRYRLIQKLATGAQPHSHLREWLLSHNDDSEAETYLEALLPEVAETRSRPTDGRTLFDLKADNIDEFNPFTTCLDRAELARAEQHAREGLGRLQSRTATAAAASPSSAAPTPIVIVPSKLPPFSKTFKPLLRVFSSPVFIELVRVVLLKAARRDSSLHQDSHVDKALFLLAIAAIEQRRDNGGLEKRFSDTPDAVALLAVLTQLSRQAQNSSSVSSGQTRTSVSPQPGELSRSQQDLINWLVKELVPVSEDTLSTPASVRAASDESAEESSKQQQLLKQKNDVAQQHRTKLMAKMAKLQRSFLENHPELGDLSQGSGSAQQGSTSSTAAAVAEPMETSEETTITANIIQQMFDLSCKDAVCMVCQDACRPAAVTRSSGNTASHQHIVVPGGSSADTAASSSPIACYVACMQRCYALAQKNATSQLPTVFMSVCGHPIHSYCWQRYTESQQARPRHRFLPGVLAGLFGGVRNQTTTSSIAPCPLCESLGNSVIPLIDVRTFLPAIPCAVSSEAASPSVLADACHLVLTITDPDERDYLIVSNHRTNATLTSPFAGASGNAVSTALTSYGRTIANILVAQAAAQLSNSGSTSGTQPPGVKMPSSPDELVRFVASAVAHTGRCVVSVILTFSASDLADESGVFNGSVRRHLDCLVAASQAGVGLSLISADSFCAVNILRTISSNLLNPYPTDEPPADPTQIKFAAPPLVDSGEFLAHLWLLEPLIRVGLQSPESSIKYASDAFWLCFLLEVGRAVSAFVSAYHVDHQEAPVVDDAINANSLIGQIWSSTALPHMSMPSKTVLLEELNRSLLPFIRLTSLLASAILNRPLTVQAFACDVPDLALLCRDALGFSAKCSPIDLLFEDISQTADDDPMKPTPSIIGIALARLKILKDNLLTASVSPDARRLISLPANYADLLSRAASFSCPSLPVGSSQSLAASSSSSSSSQQPVLCLLCDSMVCGTSCEHCSRKLTAAEISDSNSGAKPTPMLLHTISCSGGRGLFLRLHDCCLIIIADSTGRSVKHPPPYTDRYGEPDPGLRRGGPLILSKQRFAEVERLWLGHGLADIAYKYFASGRSAAADLIFAGLDPGALAMVGLDPAGLL